MGIFIHPITFDFVRHGQSTAGRDGVFAGGTVDVDLTEDGERQASSCGCMLALFDDKPKVIICSNMLRAKRTTDLIVEEAYRDQQKPEIIIERGIGERNWGEWAGKSKEGYRRDSPHFRNPPGGETLDDYYQRTNTALFNQLKQHTDSPTPMISAHRGTLEALLADFGLSMPGEPENAVIYRVEIVQNPVKSSQMQCKLSKYMLQENKLILDNVRLVMPNIPNTEL